MVLVITSYEVITAAILTSLCVIWGLLMQKPSIGQREWPPIDVEVMALVQLSCVPVLVRLQDETTVELIADSWTTTKILEKQASSISYRVTPCGDDVGQRR